MGPGVEDRVRAVLAGGRDRRGDTRVAAVGGKLTAHFSGWDLDLWQLASWYREG